MHFKQLILSQVFNIISSMVTLQYQITFFIANKVSIALTKKEIEFGILIIVLLFRVVYINK